MSEFNKYDINGHKDHIMALRYRYASGIGNFEAIEKARLDKLEYFNPTKRELTEWIEDIQKNTDMERKQKNLISFYEHITNIYPVAQYWKPYLEVCMESHTANLDGVISKAIEFTSYDFQNSNMIWSPILDYISKSDLEEQEKFNKQLKYHLKRLEYCNANIDVWFQEFSAFISKCDKTNYDKHMNNASRIVSKTKKGLRYYEVFELKLAKADSPDEKKDIWIEYLKQVSKYPQSKHHKKLEVFTMFERALNSLNDQNAELGLWLAFIFILYDESMGFTNTELEPLLSKFVKSFPHSCLSYAEYIRCCREFENGFEKFQAILERLVSLNYFMDNEDTPYDSWKILGLSILSYQVNFIDSKAPDSERTEQVLDQLYECIAGFIDFATLRNNDGFHSVERVSISIFETLNDWDNAKMCISKLLQNFSNQSEVWLYVIEFEKRRPLNEGESENDRTMAISGILESAVNFATELDWPEKIIQEWLSFQQFKNSLGEYKKCLLRANEIITLVNIKRFETEQAELALQIQKQPEASRKRSRDSTKIDQDTAAPGNGQGDSATKRVKLGDRSAEVTHRNREDFTVRVRNLPPTVTENKVSSFFQDCGTPIEIKIFHVDTKTLPVATVEFSNEQEVLSALTKTMKLFEGTHKIDVARESATTIWVTNYPPSIDHLALEQHFGTVGKILSTRFPSLKYNKNRRFCYIEYSTSEIAQFAVSKFNGKEMMDDLDGQTYKMVVKISRPEERENRINPIDEGREIFIQNLDFKKVTRAVLEANFEEFGTIERVSLPLKKTPSGLSSLNNGFGFITFKSAVSAKNAVEMNGRQIEGRNIHVSISQPKGSHNAKDTPPNNNRSTEKFEGSRSISLLFGDDTVSEEQVKRLASSVGRVSKVELLAGSGAKVEFENIADSGKAAMVLSDKELNGKKIQVGTLNDIKATPKIQATTLDTKPKLMIPTSLVRRKKRM